MTRPLATLILLLAAAAGQPAAATATTAAQKPAAAEQPAIAEAAILQVMRDAEAAWNAGDIPTYMQSYWQSDRLRFASGDRVSYGWQTVLDRYLKSYPDRDAMGRLEFSELEIQLTGSDDALVFGRWRLILREGRPHGLFTLIFRRFPVGWRIIHDHTSSAAAVEDE